MPILPWIQALAGPMLGALGSGIQTSENARIARENTDKTIAANRAMAEYQYNKDVEMWNRGNVYNSPLAQMERLKKAGLNPNMVYGSGNAAGMSAGQLPKYNAPTLDYNYKPAIDIPSMIGAFQDFRLRGAEIRKADLNYRMQTEPIQYGGFKDSSFGDGSFVIEKGEPWRVKASQEAEKRMRDLWSVQQKYKADVPRYQTDMMREQARKLTLEQDRIISATRNLDLQNDYFAARAITDLFGKTVAGVKGLAGMFRGGKAIPAAKGALSPGTVRYNSPSSWERMLKGR